MSKDFANSFEQRMWASSLESHSRAIRCLQGLGPGMEKHVEFWTKVKDEAERRYPVLAKKSPPEAPRLFLAPAGR